MVEKKKQMIDCYDRIYSKDSNFKESWDGKIAVEYKVPKYLKAFISYLKGNPPMAILELGAGNGEVSELVRQRAPRLIKDYVATELSIEGVKRLREKGFKAYQVDAQDLSMFKDNSFDLVYCVDVMHHVSDPKKMAAEMMRVSRKYVFLIEANGACVLRKLLELTPKYKGAGENSYPPWRYKSFFKRTGNVRHFLIKPFLFMVPFTPRFLFKPMIALSEFLEWVPLIRWQGSGVVMFVEKKR